MRSMFRSVFVALVAVFAFGAVVSASASAELPEFATNAPPPYPKYSGESGEVTLQTTESHTKGYITVHCKASYERGEIYISNAIGKVHITYTGCKVKAGTLESVCTSAGAASGEIVSNTLKAKLVYTSKAAKEVGLVFKPEAEGGAFAEYTCALVSKVKLTGSVVSKLSHEQINELRTSFTWNYRQKAGIQEPVEYEEGSKKISAFLTSAYLGRSEQTGEETTETMTFGEAMEIVA